jgi:hypothetical protein
MQADISSHYVSQVAMQKGTMYRQHITADDLVLVG